MLSCTTFPTSFLRFPQNGLAWRVGPVLKFCLICSRKDIHMAKFYYFYRRGPTYRADRGIVRKCDYCSDSGAGGGTEDFSNLPPFPFFDVLHDRMISEVTLKELLSFVGTFQAFSFLL